MDIAIALAYHVPVSSAAIAVFALLNAGAFAAFYVDKRRARRGGRRIPEGTLQFLALLGGFVGGAAGIVWFRHKTRKWGFLSLFAAASVVSIAAWLALARALR